MASHSSLNTSEKPSEASLPFGVFSPPKNHYEWKRALHDVKWLCFNQQYKQCALRCNQLIDTASHPLHPIRATYLHYYAATSYEYMGRAAHIFSAVKVALLTDAMDRFQNAYESLPATVPLPALNPNQTYSPVTFLHSPGSSPRSSVTTVAWSPPLPDRAVAGLCPNFEALSVENLSAHNASLVCTPPMPVPYASSSSNSSLTTDFCVTPPPAAREVSRLDYRAPPPAFHIPPPTRKPPPPPQEVSARTATRNELVSFNSARDGLPNGGSVVRSIARMIDNSMLAGENDPFVTQAPAKPRIPSQPPLRLSPFKVRGELEDPVKRSELMPPPLAIRKTSGEVFMCNNPAMVNSEGPKQETSKFEVNRPFRARPPRLPLKIIPSACLNANTKKPVTPTPAPRPKHLGPVQPSPVASTPSTPSPVMRKSIPIKSPFISRAGSSVPKSTKSPSTPSTPSPVMRKSIPIKSPFISRAGSSVPKSTKSPSPRSTKPSPVMRKRIPIKPTFIGRAGSSVPKSTKSPSTPSTPSPVMRKSIPIKSPFISRAGSSVPKSTKSPSPRSTKPSPVMRKRIPIKPTFIGRAGSPVPKSTKSPSPRSSPAPISAERRAQINEFNSAIKWLRENIPAEMTELRQQIKHVSELQQAHRSNTAMTRTASFWTFSPVKTKPGEPKEPPAIEGPNIDEYGNVIRNETKEQRIKRLRQEDWKIGIQSKHSFWKGAEYYDKLCETALAELGETGYGSREWMKRD